MFAHHEFMKPYKSLTLSEMEPYLNMGLVYSYKRDLKHRPIIFINVERLVKTDMEIDELIKLSVYFLDYIMTKALIPSKIENWFVIIDCKNVGITQIPR